MLNVSLVYKVEDNQIFSVVFYLHAISTEFIEEHAERLGSKIIEGEGILIKAGNPVERRKKRVTEY